MKKIISVILVAVMLCALAVSFSSCGDKKEYVALDATDLLQEDFGIAITKGNDNLKNEVNKVIDKWLSDGTMDKYLDYYNGLSDYVSGLTSTMPEANGLKVNWDFGDATEVITVYTESGFAPFEFLSGTEVVGLDIAIMSEVAVNMGKKIVVSDGDFDAIPTNVQTAKGDAVGAAGMSITDGRKETVDFSNVYFSSTLSIVTVKDKSISKLADLSGLKVGVQQGTSGDLIISKAKTSDGYTYEDEGGKTVKINISESTDIKQYKQYSLAFEDLKAGRIDAILMDKLPAQTLVAIANN